jgi:hypothetical protein
MRLLTKLLLVVAVTLSVIGCGASSTKEPTGTGEKTPTAGFIALMQAGTQVAHTATYVLSGMSVGTQVVVQRQGANYYAADTSGSSTEIRVTDGTDQYVCESDTKACSRPSFSESIADFGGYYVAEYWIAKMQQWPTYIPGQFAAVTITPSTMSFADQQADCITYENPTESAKVCLFDSGVIAWLQSGSADFYATQYAPGVSPDIFAVPAGYTVAAP